MKIVQRIKNAAKAFKESEEISPEELRDFLASGEGSGILVGELGDGKAELLTDFTEEEYNNYIRDEEQGWGKWRKKLGF